MRGSSALQAVFDERPAAKLEVLVVWLPVIPTDIAPPTKGVLARLHDSRATQFWDVGRLTSKTIRSAVEKNPQWVKPEDQDLCWGQGVVWDFVAVFPEGARWDELPPPPDFYGYPVVESIEGLQKRLDAITP
ncbi:MAG: hypothetical protein JNK60_11345 [Acidobacteria bacterium]|nr:hypothetical protein [Acidobacteriota bacterium]